MEPDLLTWLTEWYQANCDGDWEHSYGVKIDTIDKPGWRLEIDLKDTVMEGLAFEAVQHNFDDDMSWWRCWVSGDKFEGAGGPGELTAMIGVFRDWVVRNANQSTT